MYFNLIHMLTLYSSLIFEIRNQHAIQKVGKMKETKNKEAIIWRFQIAKSQYG